MTPNEASNLIAGLALTLSVVAFVRGEFARRSAGRDVDRANEAAEQTARALDRVSEQFGNFLSRQEKRDQRQWLTRRSYPDGPDDVGSQARSGPWAGPMPQGPTEPVVHWTVDKIQGRRHTLTNIGRATAYEVGLSSENAARFDWPEERRDLQPGESVEFLAVGSMQTGTPELLVTWSDEPDGDRQEWRRPVP